MNTAMLAVSQHADNVNQRGPIMPRKPSDTVQTAVRLPREMYERLKSSPLGVSEEIRSRLERTVAEDSDPVTRELVVGILNLVEAIRADLGVWHEQTPAHHAFAAAVAQLLADYRPLTPLTGAVADLFGRPEELETIGRTLGRHDQRSHSYEHLKARQQQRSRALAAGRARRAKKEGDEQ